MNEQLITLYKEMFPSLTEKLNGYNQKILIENTDLSNQASNPLLLAINDDWENADIKIMIFGQETNYWAGECGNNAVFCGEIERVIDVYKQWFLGNKMYNSPFWNEFRRIGRELKIEFPDLKISLLWNNISKIGRLGKGHVNEIYDITKSYFDVISDEINVLKPNYAVFFTGPPSNIPSYDEFINNSLGSFERLPIRDFDIKAFCELQFENKSFAKKAYRTYHPNAMYFKSIREEYMNCLINLLKCDINSSR